MIPKLLISGILYTPYGDKNGFDKPLKYDKLIKKYKYPLPLKPYCDNLNIGQLIDVKIEYYNNVPVFYGLGINYQKKSINRILRTSLRLESRSNNFSYGEMCHSWCADIDYNEVGEEVNRQPCKCGNCGFTEGDKEFVPKYIELKKISGASLVRNPCCAYTSIYLPNAHGFHNKNLYQEHKDRKNMYEEKFLDKIYQKIKMDGYKFKSLFGKSLKQLPTNNNSFLNLKKDPDLFYKIAKSIPYSC